MKPGDIAALMTAAAALLTAAKCDLFQAKANKNEALYEKSIEAFVNYVAEHPPGCIVPGMRGGIGEVDPSRLSLDSGSGGSDWAVRMQGEH